MRLLFAIALLATGARASNVSNELSSNSTQATDANPRAGNVSDALAASFDLSDDWTLNAGASLTAESKTAALERGSFGSSGNAVTAFSLGIDWQASESWTTALSVDFSPPSTQYTGTQVQVDAAGTQANALLRSRSSSVEAGLDLTYDTAGESALEWSFGGGITTTHLVTDQSITAVRYSAGGKVATTQQVRDYCASNKCPAALLLALRPQTNVTLDSQKLSGSVTAIAGKDTDLTLAGDYYIYDQDPTQVGYYSVARVGRFGNGLNIAPVKFTVRPEVAHRFGDFSVKVWVQAGRYVPGTGQSTASAGLKLQYKFSKAFKMWATASGERDVGEPDVKGQSSESNSSSLSLGAGYRF
jgi:hypothetical protein